MTRPATMPCAANLAKPSKRFESAIRWLAKRRSASTGEIARALGVTTQTARMWMLDAEDAGWVVWLGRTGAGSSVWAAVVDRPGQSGLEVARLLVEG